MKPDAELFARWQLAEGEAAKVPFKTQDDLLRRLSGLISSPQFLELARDFYVTKRGKYDVRLHAWCRSEDSGGLIGLVMEKTAPCEVVEMEIGGDTAVCHPAFGKTEHEPIFRAYLRQVTEIGSELLLADPAYAKRLAIQSKYVADPMRVLGPGLTKMSERYRAFDERSRQAFWLLFKMKETDTPWSHFFYNLILGLDWSPEQMTEAEAAALLLEGEAQRPGRTSAQTSA